VSFDIVGDARSWEAVAIVGDRLVRLTVLGAAPAEISLRTVDVAVYRPL